MKQKIFLTICLLGLITPRLHAYKIDWGLTEKSPGRVTNLLPVSGKDFFALRYKGQIFSSLYVTYHSSFVMSATGRIKMSVDNNMTSFEDCIALKGKLYVFMSDKIGTEEILYMQEFSKNIEPVGDPMEVGRLTAEKKRSSKSFSILASRDDEFFTVYWEVVERKSKHTTYGYKVYDSELNVNSEGEYELPFEDGLADITALYLSNTGDFFMAIEEYSLEDGQKLKKRSFKSMHIYQITPDGLDEFSLDMGGRVARTLILTGNNDNLFTLTGLYSKSKASGIKGVFSIIADFDKKQVISESFEDFSKDFITEGWSDKQKKKADKRASKGKGQPQLYNYIMRNTEVTKNGDIVGSIEQYYVRVVTHYNQNGSTTTTYYYYYNDIIAFKINKDGRFAWLKKILKRQVSTNDGGPFSSYARFVDDGKLCFIFNDSEKNYDENGKFIVDDDNTINYARFDKKKNRVALVTLDLEDGEMERKTFFSRKDVGTVAVPKLFRIDYKNRTMLLYTFLRRKERFGLLTMNE